MVKENHFSGIMVNKTDSELREYINNKSKYQEDAFIAAIWELERRGKSGKDMQQAEKLAEEITTRKQEQAQILQEKSKYTDDPNAPRLFPRWSIWLFSIFFSAIYAGILMAMNFYQTKQKKEIGLVLGFTVIIYVFLLFLFFSVPGITYITIYNISFILSLVGAVILDQYIWNMRLGKDLKYRKRPVFTAFIISLAISGFMLWISITYGTMFDTILPQ